VRDQGLAWSRRTKQESGSQNLTFRRLDPISTTHCHPFGGNRVCHNHVTYLILQKSISYHGSRVAACIMSICTVSRRQCLDQPNEDFRNFISQNWLTIFNATSLSGCDRSLSARHSKPGFKLALHILLNPLAELPNAAHKAAT